MPGASSRADGVTRSSFLRGRARSGTGLGVLRALAPDAGDGLADRKWGEGDVTVLAWPGHFQRDLKAAQG